MNSVTVNAGPLYIMTFITEKPDREYIFQRMVKVSKRFPTLMRRQRMRLRQFPHLGIL